MRLKSAKIYFSIVLFRFLCGVGCCFAEKPGSLLEEISGHDIKYKDLCFFREKLEKASISIEVACYNCYGDYYYAGICFTGKWQGIYANTGGRAISTSRSFCLFDLPDTAWEKVYCEMNRNQVFNLRGDSALYENVCLGSTNSHEVPFILPDDGVIYVLWVKNKNEEFRKMEFSNPETIYSDLQLSGINIPELTCFVNIMKQLRSFASAVF